MLLTKANTIFIHNYTVRDFSRTFASYSPLLLPVENDQDELFEQFEDLEEEFNETDGDIEQLAEVVREGERSVQDGDEETELSKFMKRREEKKDDLVGRYGEYKDNALFNNEDKREDVSLTLELIKKSARKDIETLKTASTELDESDEVQDEISRIIPKLEAQKEKASKLLVKLHENDLNFIRPSNSENPESSVSNQAPQTHQHMPQDSSDVHRTDFSPFDDIGDD